jgi:hypothetical protein
VWLQAGRRRSAMTTHFPHQTSLVIGEINHPDGVKSSPAQKDFYARLAKTIGSIRSPRSSLIVKPVYRTIIETVRSTTFAQGEIFKSKWHVVPLAAVASRTPTTLDRKAFFAYSRRQTHNSSKQILLASGKRKSSGLGYEASNVRFHRRYSGRHE